MAFACGFLVGSDFKLGHFTHKDERSRWSNTITPNKNAEVSTDNKPQSDYGEEHGLSVFFASAGCLPHLFGLCARHGAASPMPARGFDMTPMGGPAESRTPRRAAAAADLRVGEWASGRDNSGIRSRTNSAIRHPAAKTMVQDEASAKGLGMSRRCSFAAGPENEEGPGNTSAGNIPIWHSRLAGDSFK